MTENQIRPQELTVPVQPVPKAPRKRIRSGYILLVLGLFLTYALGLVSHPFLFGTSAETAAGGEQGNGSPEATADQTCPWPEVDLEGMSVMEAYQAVLDEMSLLNSRVASDAELAGRFSRLEEEVRQLRLLNPYYRFKEIRAEVIPTGVPGVYGQELGVSFDQVQPAINVMSKFDPTYGKEKIVLQGADLERYVRVGMATACLYCCQARTLVQPNGTAACGCDHSQAMRGLAAYIITNHPDAYSDEELVNELNRWRAVYFPKQTLMQSLNEMKEAGAPGIEEILQEFPEFMPQMVGGC